MNAFLAFIRKVSSLTHYFEHTHLPLKTWFIAIQLLTQAKTCMSALELHRHLNVNVKTAQLLKHKIMQTLTEAEDKRVLQGRIECDDAYLGGANKSQGLNSHSKKKVPFLAAVQTDESHHPHHAVSSQLHSFTYEQLKEWGQKHFCASACLLSDTAGFYKGIDNICEHRTYNKSQLGPVLVKKSFKWTDTIQTSFSGAIHAFDFRKYGCRYLGKFRFKAMFL